MVSQLAQTLQTFISAFPRDRAFALVGGLAVSVRTEPRFTRDVDVAVAVTDDADAERIVYSLREHGFVTLAAIESTTAKRLATVRLRMRESPFVDLLFAACGVESEIVSAASVVRVLGLVVPVATVGHLIAMKLVSNDPARRPRDAQDLVELAKVADALEWDRATQAVQLIHARGFDRGRDLLGSLRELRGLGPT